MPTFRNEQDHFGEPIPLDERPNPASPYPIIPGIDAGGVVPGQVISGRDRGFARDNTTRIGTLSLVKVRRDKC